MLFPWLCRLFPPRFTSFLTAGHLSILRLWEKHPPYFQNPCPSCLNQSFLLAVSIGQCPFFGSTVSVSIQWMSFSHSTLLSTLSFCVFLSLSLSHTHTHTRTHDCTMNACSPCSSFRFLKDRNGGCQSPSLYFHCPLLNAYLLLLDIVMFNFSIIRKAETCHYILFIGINRYTTFMVWGTF